MPLSFGQVVSYWELVGGTHGWGPLAAGIAYSESGWTPRASNPTDRHTNGALGSYGLWQIGVTHAPGGFGTRTPAFVQSLLTPAQNAAYAVNLSGNGANWSPWTTDGTWKQWVAHGKPHKPSAQTVLGWIGQKTTHGGYTTPVQPANINEITPAQLPSAGTIEWAFANLANWVNIYSVDEYNVILQAAQALGRV